MLNIFRFLDKFLRYFKVIFRLNIVKLSRSNQQSLKNYKQIFQPNLHILRDLNKLLNFYIQT